MPDPLVEYRAALFEKLAAQPRRFAALAASQPDVEWQRRRGTDDLTLHQMAAHLRDAVVLAFYPRIERILAEESPHLEPFPYHYWSIENGYKPDEPLSAIVRSLADTYEALLTRARALSVEDWARVGFHPPSGPRTVQWWTEHIHSHTAIHLDDLAKSLAV